jgi:predicted CXXCH cytochrome family protein
MMKRDKAVILSLIVTVILTGLSGLRDSSAQGESCVTAKCHARMGKDKAVHNPVKEGMCTMCHQAVEQPGETAKHPGNLRFSLVQQGADLCYQCHEPKNKKKIVHAPVMAGDCTPAMTRTSLEQGHAERCHAEDLFSMSSTAS